MNDDDLCCCYQVITQPPPKTLFEKLKDSIVFSLIANILFFILIALIAISIYETRTHRLVMHGWNHWGLFGDDQNVDEMRPPPVMKERIPMASPRPHTDY